MMRVVAALCYLLAAHLVMTQVVEAQAQEEEEEDVSEVAPYTVIKEAQGYEERAYPASPWVCHQQTLPQPSMSSSSFWPLFGYISGANKQQVNIPMTAPVTVRLRKNTDAEKGTWDTQMCFYVPEAYQQSPPEPANEAVQVVFRPAMNVFSRRTGGNLTTEGWSKLANELKTLLESSEPAADLSTYYIAGYDDPKKATNRRNEVWFKKP